MRSKKFLNQALQSHFACHAAVRGDACIRFALCIPICARSSKAAHTQTPIYAFCNLLAFQQTLFKLQSVLARVNTSLALCMVSKCLANSGAQISATSLYINCSFIRYELLERSKSFPNALLIAILQALNKAYLSNFTHTPYVFWIGELNKRLFILWSSDCIIAHNEHENDCHCWHRVPTQIVNKPQWVPNTVQTKAHFASSS